MEGDSFQYLYSQGIFAPEFYLKSSIGLPRYEAFEL